MRGVGVGTAVGLGLLNGLLDAVSVAVAPAATVAVGEMVDACVVPDPDAVAVGVWCIAERATTVPLTPPTSRAPQITKTILFLMSDFSSPCCTSLLPPMDTSSPGWYHFPDTRPLRVGRMGFYTYLGWPARASTGRPTKMPRWC